MKVSKSTDIQCMWHPRKSISGASGNSGPSHGDMEQVQPGHETNQRAGRDVPGAHGYAPIWRRVWLETLIISYGFICVCVVERTCAPVLGNNGMNAVTPGVYSNLLETTFFGFVPAPFCRSNMTSVRRTELAASGSNPQSGPSFRRLC